ncbi:aquaporin AQPAe.a-like [Lepidochelys kempii]|uniref:aquaporin AQPAe.a-like n=1 Tax=Lepidochelys kempii TaxID=8472 RepID=UPI003C705869
MAIGEDLRSRRFWCSLLAEAAGTLIFVWLVLGASCPSGPGRVTAPPALQPALTAGLAALGLAHCFGEVSGAQANPALTLAFLCTRKLDALHGAAYILAQCLGAVLASAAVCLALPAAAASHLVTRVSSEGNAGQALAMETFSTFQLAFTIFAVEDQRRRGVGEPGGLAIGFSVTAGALAAGTFSGGSMNPARSLGPAVLTGIWDHHWVYRISLGPVPPQVYRISLGPVPPQVYWISLGPVYWIGPSLGAVLAGLSYEFLFASSASREKLVACLTCRDIDIVETASVSHSSLSTTPQDTARAKPPRKGEQR